MRIKPSSRICSSLIVGLLLLSACGGNEDSAGSTIATSTTEMTTTTTNPPPTCAEGGECAVGDTGPGGGIIAYVASEPFSNEFSDCAQNCHFHGEASKEESSPCGKLCYYLEMYPRPIGVAADWEEATKQVSLFSSGGYTDWFLPTMDQVYLIWDFREKMQNNTGTYSPDYWTSSFDSEYTQPYFYKSDTFRVGRTYWRNPAFALAFRAG